VRFAVVEGERREAQPGQLAKCPHCGGAVIAKCGDHRVWHWAHQGSHTCDPWWESETEWHRAWKDHFPKSWQEIRRSKDGEMHIADVMTEGGMVIEFQHSYLRREEREARESFYQKMVWVVNGRRLKLDRARFFKSLDVAAFDPLTVLLHRKLGLKAPGTVAGRVAEGEDLANAVAFLLSQEAEAISGTILDVGCFAHQGGPIPRHESHAG
jgi:competence protein CoiA